ncbi:nucleoside 2-deoxyribosyltransferase [Clostridium botulinum D/C]|uniref:nucleoside 2-deoxyribosyltransferase n=1 Tax=Clostridium botulinum TaxID=1491 RepID=UPI001E60CDE0|nr:nucleoside 2-deoxyribosyltransferase [Clostridium botulinum]MCD3321679.1 nucleoside 2-deoxyribosyltransferase [Clostridium botulinum D/C]MCD3324960.1 nucleoside 2-deoxyribosyltransferase [Clostridium botulinum D/C]MCD3327738.1 nucleoside 2-deoxyribosyltransferase [Clostridium botulinum D/C]
MKNINIKSTTTEQKQGYIAGGLFNEADISQRLKEGKLLRENTNIEFYNPIEAPCNDKSKLPTDQDIFNMDTQKVLQSHTVVADISTRDEGVMAELGITWMCNFVHYLAGQGYSLEDILKYIPKKQVYANLPDIRKDMAHNYKGNYIPVGFNQFIIGMIRQIGNVYDEFDDILQDLKKDDK